MWQLHQQGAGGIVGDEMGLGKTVQIAAYLGALHASGKLRSAIVVAPATVLAHWVRELHVWAPRLRVVLLHRSGAAYNAAWGAADGVDTVARRALRLAPAVVALTSYEGLRTLQRRLLSHDWDVAVLDEAQRIRNPDADITLVCKQLRTSARLALTGTPIQNSLLELWSLFDFVFPGRLGTLPAFDSEFATPIRVGGYANASPAQAQLAYRCAVVLRGLIDPHLLRRQKHDVRDAVKLPHKTEQVLFCRLTRRQRALYMDAICSPQVRARSRCVTAGLPRFRAIGVLRKLCNHADLACPPGASIAAAMAGTDPLEAAESDSDSELVGEEAEFGAAERSGKLLVLQQLLPLWRAAGHRVLVFTQTRGMLGILERWVRSRGWVYGRLDGNTPVGARQGLIDRFNTDPEVFIMLLTTRTGGVGTNLTGADRVLLFDPDWNPSTDAQARERAWRVGQTKPVTVYRLITAGTIEEKIYHRQIFKTALTNRVLKDPRQRRLFNRSDLHELFLLGDDGSADGLTETNDVFQGAGVVELKKRPSRRNGATEDPGDAPDAGVLRALFDKAPLSGVFVHDLAEGGSAASAARQARRAQIERQAEAAAIAALERLRESRRAIHADLREAGSAGDFVPTWTGRSGAGGRRFGGSSGDGGGGGGSAGGMSSQALLQCIQQRHTQRPPSPTLFAEATAPAAAAAAAAAGGGGGGELNEQLLRRLQQFFRERRNVRTDDILAEFADVQDQHAVVFKQLLRAVAVCRQGVWSWKEDADF
ncbi:P-loop containing nucleoside triphosphate hydrolase protein [Tribonema minus]|uniref:P-loop containing nucleoside triphosphate hydrolase protein n=1 Tax=Tribonema minus TaxID=303371 RepID=A0A835YM12_9STRA|nr:P-loop containing nucleoside triphosphate hydrolase protein [Tribonema minus]